MLATDLTPFGFTATESRVYRVLLRLGTATGYAVAHAAGIARANAYGALEGLVARGAAARRSEGRPLRYRPTDPQALLVELAARQGEALDRLSRALRETSAAPEPETRFVDGSRALANVVLQLVARAERRVVGVLAAELLRPTLPAWRRAAARATVELRLAGGAPEADRAEFVVATVAAEQPTILLVDDAQVVAAPGAPGATGAGAGDRSVAGLWSSHPAVVALARAALEAIAGTPAPAGPGTR